MNFIIKQAVLLLCTIALHACQLIRTSSTHISESNAILHGNFQIDYFADYRFHKLVPREMLHFNKQLKKEIQRSSGKLMYAGHTVITPYGSTVGVAYDGNSQSCADQTSEILKETYSAFNVKTEHLNINQREVIRVRYDLREPRLGVDHKFLDYYVQVGNHTYRIIFWTLTRDIVWLKKESESIIATIEQKP